MTPRNVFRFAVAVCLAGAVSAQTRLFEKVGPTPKSSFGAAVAGVGDVDADGFVDFAVGAPRDDTLGADAGMVRVYSGYHGGVLFTLLGANAYDNFGLAIAAAGDVDGDGRADFAIAAPEEHTDAFEDAGVVRIFAGADGDVLGTLTGGASHDNFGAALAALGDANGDGNFELLVGVPGDDATANGAGRASVYDPSTLALGRSFFGAESGDHFGGAVAFAGDVNKDGAADVLVGAPQADPNGSNSGVAVAYSTADGDELHVFFGDAPDEKTGASLAGLGDLDGDGFGDVAVGAPFAKNGGTARFGRVRIYSGKDGNAVHTWYGDSKDDRFGWSVAGLGDVDGDGVGDVAVGAPHDDDEGSKAGSVRLFSGADGDALATIHGGSAGAEFGSAVAAVGDLTGDLAQELAAGAHAASGSTGFARVYSAVEQAGAGVVTVGEGCGALAPTLDAEGPPTLGAKFSFLLAGGKPTATAAFAYSNGAAGDPIQLAGDCKLYLTPGALYEMGAAFVPGSGNLKRSLVIPSLPSLAGMTFTAQVLVMPTDGAGGYDLTNAVELTLGY